MRRGKRAHKIEQQTISTSVVRVTANASVSLVGEPISAARRFDTIGHATG